jgi:nucleoside-diphosphate-sugar epimerase
VFLKPSLQFFLEDMQRRVPSLEKAQRLIGYQPTRKLEDIINDVADQFREELKTETANA